MAKGVSPEAIEKTDFPTSLRGYDKEEVDAYLRMVAAEHRKLLEASRTARTGSDKPYHRLGEDVGELLQHAKDSSDRLKERAEEDAARVREEAKKVAKETKEKARKDAKEIREAAHYEASERIKDAQRGVDELRKTEAAISERLEEMRAGLRAVLEQLDGAAAADEAPKLTIEEPAAEGGAEDKPAKVIVIDAESEQSPASTPSGS
jgi:cell division initiation protein